MLQQILRDMWVDPEILAELDENQKQVLFCKMREEQVRRWAQWDQQHPIETDRPGKKRKVGFMLGADGEPWVWVMGEHEDDLSIEIILEHEAKEAARKLALHEAQQLRLSVEAELGALLEESKKLDEDIVKEEIIQKESTEEDIYCSVDEIRLRPTTNHIKSDLNSNRNNSHNNLNNINNNTINNNINITSSKRDALQEISLNKPKNVLQKVALWEKKVMEERTSEIYQRIQLRKQEANKEAEEMESKHEHLWIEQQRKAKEAEIAKREIARRAREEHRRSVQDLEPPALPPRAPTSNSIPPSPLRSEAVSLTSSKPPSKDAILEWFKSSQFTRRAGLEPNGNDVAPWFHGLISRSEAEGLLIDQPVGSFLVRVSERIWGYAISYKDTDRCKHYLIDASSGHYQFLGNNQMSHETLYDLINYHGAKPITALGGELLGKPCDRNEAMPAIFQGLIRAR